MTVPAMRLRASLISSSDMGRMESSMTGMSFCASLHPEDPCEDSRNTAGKNLCTHAAEPLDRSRVLHAPAYRDRCLFRRGCRALLPHDLYRGAGSTGTSRPSHCDTALAVLCRLRRLPRARG